MLDFIYSYSNYNSYNLKIALVSQSLLPYNNHLLR